MKGRRGTGMEKVRYMISDAANIVNVESHVLRYWEDELELNVPRNELGHRYYTKENIQEFQRIKELKEQGYQLKAIRMIVHNMSPDAQAEVGAVHPGEKQDLHQVTCTSNEKVIKPEQQPGAQVSHIPDGYAVKADLPVAAGQNTPRSAQNESQSVLDNTDKMAQFTELMTQIVGTAIAANNQELSRCISEDVGEQVIKEMNYLMREQDEADEERFRKLDAAIRGNLKKKEPKKRWGRNKKEKA
jgi:DNA-binding transcriptional MerR regulator